MNNIKQSVWKKNTIVLLIYIIFTTIFNFSLLLGKNLMKWDIMDAYYPLCMLSADMLREGRLPLWNAALQFGCPAYIMVGIPYWYPTTLFFEITTGYSLICIAIEYCMHIVLACFGMFLLTKEHLEQKETMKSYLIAVIAGALYGFSGLFISNAQHIMIIISAAWLPYIFLFVKKYFEKGKKLFLMAAAFCLGLSILGGYPEIWVASFIILIPYFVIHAREEKNFFIKVLRAAGAYIIFGCLTAAAAAISLVPFLMSSRYMGRLGGGVAVSSYSVKMVVSSILSHYSEFAKSLGETLDISMISMYVGLLTLVLVGWIFALKLRKKWQYIGICIFAFLMMLGNNSFLHPVFYKYFPLFKSLRFPSLWRCVFTVFLLLLAAEVLEVILEDMKQVKRLALVCGISAIVFFVGGLILPKVLNHSVEDYIYEAFQIDMIRDAIVFGGYGIAGAAIICLQKKYKKNMIWILGLAVAMDIFVCQQSLHGVTVASYSQWDRELAEACEDWVEERYIQDAERTHSIDYSDAKRSQEGLNSTNIVMNHTLDEMGYLSIQLNYVQKYRKSEHCAISVDVPEVYITNDVVSAEDVVFDEWLQDGTVSPYQIYVDDNKIKNNTDGTESQIDIEYFISGDMKMKISQETDGYLVVQQSYYPGWKVYVDGKEAELEKVNDTFLGVYLTEGVHQVHFEFKPADFYVGAGITVIFIIVFIVNLVLYIKRKDGEEIDVDRENKSIHGEQQ